MGKLRLTFLAGAALEPLASPTKTPQPFNDEFAMIVMDVELKGLT